MSWPFSHGHYLLMDRYVMKWFKHQSTARNDEKIARLEDRCGLEGYGFYFKMLELVAEAIDQSDKCEVTYSMSRWGRQTNVTTKKWLFLAQCCADVGLMIVQRSADDGVTNGCRGADDITIKIPNLLKYRDNHTKNLQVTSKQDKEVYKEDKDKEKHKHLKPTAVCTAGDEVAETVIETTKKPTPPYQKIVEAYHEQLPTLPQVYKLSEQRKLRIKTLWADELDDLGSWGNYFKMISRSDFLMGRSPPCNGRSFVADFDFIINPTNFIKIAEEKYHGKKIQR